MRVRQGFITGIWITALASAADAQIRLREDRRTLEVTSARMRVVFRGADVVAVENLLTGASAALDSAGEASAKPVAMLVKPNGSAVPESDHLVWAVEESQDGLTSARIVSPDGSAPGLGMTVRIDPQAGQIVVRISARVFSPGLRGIRWGLRNLDLTKHRLILPVLGGIVFDQSKPPPAGFSASSESQWEAPFLLLASQQGGMVVFNSKHEAPFRMLEVVSPSGEPNGGSRTSLAIESRATGLWSEAASIAPVEWRLDCYRGSWMDGADLYRRATPADWAEPALSPAGSWIRDIRTVITLSGPLLDPDQLAALTNPKQTLLYLPGWRASCYDCNYPDYTPLPEAAAYIARAHELGFRVMLHVNPFGVSPAHPDYERVRRYQMRDPQSGALQGWRWDQPDSEPARFAFLNPAAPEWRSLFIGRLRPAIAQLRPDALHLDQAGLLPNDGNGLVDSRTPVEGVIELCRQLNAVFPGVLLASEGVNDQIAPLVWLSQRWSARQTGVPGDAHPLTSYLLGSRCFRLYGYLGMPSPGAPGYMTNLRQYERQAVLPTISLGSEDQIDSMTPDLRRAFRVARLWQDQQLEPRWTPLSNESRLFYQGTSDSAGAMFQADGASVRMDAGGQTVYQRASGVSIVDSPLMIPGWPAFDAQRLFGLDPLEEYWLDPGDARPINAAHVSNLPGDVMLDNQTIQTPDSMLLALRPASRLVFDAVESIGRAKAGMLSLDDGDIGLPVSGPAAVSTGNDLRVGGQGRTAILVHPPGGPASTYLDFPVTLPANSRLTFSTGILDGAQRTEPVRFSVCVDDVEIWRCETVPGRWAPATVDLSPFAGRSVRIRFLTQAGNAAFASAAFSDPRITEAPAVGAGVTVEVTAPGREAVVVATQAVQVVAGESGRFELSRVPLESRIPIFYRPLRTFQSGQSLLDLPFTNLQQQKNQMAVPGPVFGSGTLQGAMSGGVTRDKSVSAHPPNDGVTQLIWTGQLPDVPSLQLAVAAGLQDGNHSEGVIFRVQINGQPAWEVRVQESGWVSGQIDLTRYRNQPVLIQLITDSAGSNAFDWAYWSDLTLKSQ